MTNAPKSTFKPNWIPLLSIVFSLVYVFLVKLDAAQLLANLLISGLLFQHTPNQIIKKKRLYGAYFMCCVIGFLVWMHKTSS